MNELTIDGKIYISSKRAAEITGYAKDYVGQLCREGHVEARMVGRSWYVLESSIRAHRFGGDPHAEPVKEPEIKEETPAVPASTWEQPKYVPETVPSMPVPTVERAVEANKAELEDPSVETLTDMEAAWKEWFAKKQDTMIETPEIIDEREEEHERLAEIDREIEDFKASHEEMHVPEQEELPEEAEEEIEKVAIQPIQQPVYAPAPTYYEEIEPESEPVTIHHAPQTHSVATEVPVLNKRERREAQKRARKERVTRKKAGGASSVVIRAALIAVMLFVIVIATIATGYAQRFATTTPMLTPIFNFLGGTSTYSR